MSLSPADLAEGRRLLAAVVAEGDTKTISGDFIAYNSWLHDHDQALLDAAERAQQTTAERDMLRKQISDIIELGRAERNRLIERVRQAEAECERLRAENAKLQEVNNNA